MAKAESRMVEEGCCVLKMLLTLSCVQTKWQPSGLSESIHQNLRLIRAFSMSELLPLPTQALQQTSSGCDRTNSPQAKLAFHRKSRQASTLSLCFYWAPCFSPSPHTKGSFLPKRKRFMMQSSAGRETAVVLRLYMRYLRFYLKNSRLGRWSVAIWVLVSRNFISLCVLDSRICCLRMVVSLRSSSSSFRMAISFCRMRSMEIVSSCSFYSLTFSPANLRLSSPSSGRSILYDLSLGIWTDLSLVSREAGSGLRGRSSLAVREREQSTMRLVWVTVRKEFFFLSSQLIRVQISLMQCLYAFFLLWYTFSAVTVARYPSRAGRKCERLGRTGDARGGGSSQAASILLALSGLQQVMEVTLSRIAGETDQWGQDRQFAEQQLRKIYSQELARMMRQKKFYLLNQTNRQRIDSRIESLQQQKTDKMAKLMEQSQARKEKLIKDRVKACEMSDKRWFHKKEEIRSRVRQQQQSMVEVAKDYRLKSQSYWKDRQAQQRQQLRDFSIKYHRLYNSNIRTPTSPNSHTGSFVSFNQEKLNSLLQKRITQRNFKTSPSQTSHEDTRQGERTIRTIEEEEKLQKLMAKLKRAEMTSSRMEQIRKKESLERAKMKLSQKVYRNNKPQIGQDCRKHANHETRFRMRTLAQQSPSASPSPQKTGLSRSSSLCLKGQREEHEKRQEHLLRYYQKTRRLKLTKQLKLNVRSMLNNQLRNNLLPKS